jgi:hypothetical protein
LKEVPGQGEPNPKPLHNRENKGLPEPRKPSEQPGERFIPRRGQEPGGQADRGAKPEPVQPKLAEARERLSKPPPEQEVVETLDPEVEEAIRQYGMAVGDPEEVQLREQAKKDPILREFFKKGPTSLSPASPDFSFDEKPENTSHS